MSCIDKIDKYYIPNDIIVLLTKIYKYIGNNNYFLKETQNNIMKVIEDTVKRDTYFLSMLSGTNVSGNRQRLIISKESNPRTIDETTLSNMKKVIENIQYFAQDSMLDSKKIINYMHQIYSDRSIMFRTKEVEEKINEWSNKVSRLKEEEQIEALYLNINYAVDLYNLSPLTANNDTLSLLSMYYLLLNAHIDSLKYFSFFESIYLKKEDFNELLNDTVFGWENGHSKTDDLIKFLFKLLLETYKNTESFVKNYSEEISSNKTDAVVNTIYHLPRTFTKDDIRSYHPYISESTINRVLSKLRDENQIKPSGNGRSAKWIKTGMF